MAESRTAETLRNKRHEIASSIDDYIARLEQAGADLAHMDAAIAIFAERGELAAISWDPLRDGPHNTRELAQAIMAAKGLDTGDKVAKPVSYRLIHVLRLQARGSKIIGIGRQKATRVWRLPEPLL